MACLTRAAWAGRLCEDVCNEIDNGPSGELEFVHLTTLEEGSFFGEQSFLARQSGHSALATATVEAGTYCELERLPFDGLQLLMAQEPELLKAIKAQARAAHGVTILNGIYD